MKTVKQFTKQLLGIVLCFAMMLNIMSMTFVLSSAADEYQYKGGAGTKVSDLDTSTKYSLSLGDNASTEYAGRVWTDKSVYTSDVSFDVFGGGTSTVKLNENNNGEDFLIAYSALATAQSVSGQAQAPVDVVLILDVSGSMSNAESNMDNGKSRIYNTVQAANATIDELMALNPYTRVAVVAFSSDAQVLLPLDRYTKNTEVNREWVSTGRFDGYYEETVVEVPYISVNRDTGSEAYADLTANAVNSASATVKKTIDVEGGTNIQIGLYEGMKLLSDEQSTTVSINGETVKRVPSVILLSDGSPTYSSGSSSWWAPSDNYNNGPGSAPYAGNGMKAILVGSYMKDAIDRNYNVENTAHATTVYTIGMGITGLNATEKDLAYMTLDPGTYWNDNNVSNSMKTAIKNYWSQYTARNNTGTLNIDVGEMVQQGNKWVYKSKNYALRHPTTGYDVDAVNGYDYVDDYYDADNASTVTSVFKEIVSNIAISAPQVPTEIKGTDPMTDGYITYTDPLGAYMEVKDVKAVIYAGQTFTAKTITVSGNNAAYTFSGEVHSPVYGDQEIKNIVITVSETDGKQTLVIKIPASVIPLRVNEVMLNTDGTVKTHTNNGAMPARVIYSVGLQSEITKEASDGTVYIDKSKISAAYLAENTNDDGTISFYSNEYTNPHLINGSTVGDATVEFEPSHANGFYYILEDMPIYKDAEFKQQVTAAEGLEDGKIYFYRDEYYHGNTVEKDAIERTGAQLKRTEIKTGTDGYLYRAEGSPRLNRILKFEGTKNYNNTNTAEDFYAPEFHYADGSTNAYDGKFIVHLGNNGLLTMTAGGDLQISKTVLAGAGLTAPDKSFEFVIGLDGEDVNNGTYDYVIVDNFGETVSNGIISASNNIITLKDGQTATIFALPPETEYTVTETAYDGFTTASVGESGTINAGQVSVASFTNTYNVEPELWPTNDDLKGIKELSGRQWSENDVFAFFISPYNNAPLPKNYDADAGVIVDKPDTEGGSAASFDFGTIEFTAPGVYRYTVFEKEPENNEYLPGMSYSRALYRIVVTVVDNGDGTLTVASSDIQKLYNDAAEPLFTYDSNGQIVMNDGEEGTDAIRFVNTYSAESVTRVPVAFKDYTDNSGKNPLVSGMFEFKLEAIGIVENGELVENSASDVPMPEGSENGAIITTNEGHNITFPSVTFTQADIPAGKDTVTFRYQMSEVIPSVLVNGMSYDETVYTVDVVVSVDHASHVLNVSPMYPDEHIVTFKNEYTPVPVSADIDGSKTLIGRDMKSGEAFEFVLDCDEATEQAINDGVVSVNSYTASVTDAKNGVANAFAFENIEFRKAGVYVFTVSETAGEDNAVDYDESIITVTVTVDDAAMDGNLEIVSVVYSNGKDAAEFVNTYKSTFSGDAVSLNGVKTLTGKTLLEGEFYFDVKEYLDGVEISDRFVTHTPDLIGTDGVYVGTITILDEVIYDKAGTYEYYITEQIPAQKVGGTEYDESKYRFTVVVTDDQNGSLAVTSAKLERANGTAWEEARSIEFNNKYTPAPTHATLPLVNKIVAGDRGEALKEGEFEFELNVVSADFEDGIILPSDTVVSNAANGNIIFDEITFTKAGYYVVSVTEIVPDDADKVAGITYSEQVITAQYHVVDDRNGVLTATLTQLIGGDSIINVYNARSADVTIDIEKTFTGRENDKWLSTDSFDFVIKVTDEHTLAAIENGDIEFAFDEGSTDTATYTIASKDVLATAFVKINKSGTYKFEVSELDGGIEGITYDKTVKEVVIVATDDSLRAQINVNLNGNDTNSVTLGFKNVYKAPVASDGPQTGDYSNLALWFALLAVSGGGLVGTAVYGKKKMT